MKWNTLEEEPCSLSRTVAVIGDRWSLLILRECFLRKRRFEAFEASLGITRHVLSDRLKKLVRFGVLRRVPYQESPKRYEYILSQKGLDLYPIIMSIVHWGDIHMGDSRGRPMLHQHKTCGHMFDPVMVCSECNAPLSAKEVHVHPGPGARKSSPVHAMIPAPRRRPDSLWQTPDTQAGRAWRVGIHVEGFSELFPPRPRSVAEAGVGSRPRLEGHREKFLATTAHF